ncbi:glycoside hydrolase [Melioribacter sp. Ez-97]|uniref:glycoside hydrolase n=1 Tax=Melioribacter sp. Ez-97 TaxID=3423434 RepID=UPI003EDA57F9
MPSKNIKYCALFFLITLCSTTIIRAQDYTLSIDTTIRYQTIDNFGASDCWSFQNIGEWNESKKNEVADLLFSTDKGIGLSAWRFNLGGGKEYSRISHPWRSVNTYEVSKGVYDWSRQAKEAWFLQAAKQRGVEQFIAFVNSPPGRMTRNGFTNCDDGVGSTNLKDGYEKEFAVYLADIIEHFRNEEDINFGFVSPVNEPYWEWNNSNQEGNRASNEDIKKIVKAIHAEFEKRNLNTEIIIPEAGSLESWYRRIDGISNKYGKLYGNYLEDFCSDTTVNKIISKNLCGHSYWSERLNEIYSDRFNLSLYFSPYFSKGWKYWMTEYCQLEGPNGEGGSGRDLSINTALNVARIIHYDLTVLNASAWQWWTAVSPENFKDGLLYTDYKNPGDYPSIYRSKLLWALGNFSRFIRPGSVRIECKGASDMNNIMASAYFDKKNKRVIVVAINMSNSSKELLIDFKGLENQIKLTPYITSNKSGDDLKEGTDLFSGETFNMPARSIVTFVGDLNITTDLKEDSNSNNKLEFGLWPNPFNSTSKISFSIKKNEHVVIEVYDLLGKKVDDLWNGEKKPGNYIITYNPGNLVSGVYILTFRAGDKTLNKKFVLLK